MSQKTYPFEVKHRDVWAIALPATFAFVTEPLAGIVDMTVIGRLGDVNLLAGLVLGAMAFGFIFAFVFFLRIGTAGLVAQSVGRRDPNDGLVHLARACLIGLALGALLIVFSLPLQLVSKYVLAPSPEAVPAFETYMGVRLWSAPIVMINFALLGWFYGRAAASLGMAVQLIVSAGNIVLSVLFVYGFGWGVFGVAFGTVLAEVIAVIVGLMLVVRHMGGIGRIVQICTLTALFDPQSLGRLFGLSRDLMIRSVVLEASFAIFVAQLSRQGTTVLAANMILLNLVMFIAFFLDGQAQAAEQICGKAVGANYRPAFERGMKLALVWGFALAAALGLLLIVGGPVLIDFMTTSVEVRAAAREHLWISSLIAVTGVMPFVMDGVMSGATLNTLIRNGMVVSFVIFLAATAVLQPLFGLNGLWVAFHLFFMARGLIFFFAVRAKTPKLFPT